MGDGAAGGAAGGTAMGTDMPTGLAIAREQLPHSDDDASTLSALLVGHVLTHAPLLAP